MRGVEGAKNPEVEGFLNVDCTSGSGNKINGHAARTQFSPMHLGPVKESEFAPMNNGHTPLSSKTFENYWQYGKIFAGLGHLSEQAVRY